MIPILKALSLIGKVFSQPIVILFKIGIKKVGGKPRETLVKWGNVVTNWEAWVNRRFLGYEGEMKEIMLTEDKALESFANFFIEIVVIYGVLGYYTISSGIQKAHDSQAESDHKEQLNNQIIDLIKEKDEMKKELIQIKAQNEVALKMWEIMIQSQNTIIQKNENNLSAIYQQINGLHTQKNKDI